MSKPLLKARPRLLPAESYPRPAVLSALRIFSRIYLRFGLGFRRFELLGAEHAVQAFSDFQKKNARLLLAFRHPNGDEPQVLAHVLSTNLPAAAGKLGTVLKPPVHVRFIHGYEVPLWSGPLVRWLLPRIGAVPVHHAKLDAEGIGRIRRIMKDGRFPLALSPEGQVSYTSGAVPRLEPGFARIALWCAQDLLREGRTEKVLVLPLSVFHRYGNDAVHVLERLIFSIEKNCGLTPPVGESSGERLWSAAERIISLAEDFYGRISRHRSAPEGGTLADDSLDRRFRDVIESALEAGERALRLEPEGNVPDRFYRIRQEGWDRIYRPELSPGRKRPPLLERALYDREAAEAWFAMRHMELADIGYYLRFDCLRDETSVTRLVDAAINLGDLLSRLMGGNFSDRVSPLKKDAVVVAGTPLDVSARLGEYGRNRRSTIDSLTAELKARYEHCASVYEKEG